MTTGDINFSIPESNRTGNSVSWTGVRGWKVWNGGDKVTQKSEVPAPRAPKPHKLRKGAFEPKAREYQVFNKVRPPKPEPTPFEGMETVRWGQVIRRDNALPKRGHAEYHDYDMTYFMSRQEYGNYTYPDYQRGDGSWAVFVGTSTPLAECGHPVFNHTWSSNDDLVMLARLRERVAGSDFNAGVFLGEGREALNMISDSATRIWRAYRHIRKGNAYDAARALGVSPRSNGKHGKATHVAQRWLELQYGWLPLIKDVYGGAQFLAHHLEVPLQRRYRVRRLALGTAEAASPGNHKLTSAHCNTRGQIIAIIREADVAKLSGLQDPASIAWELLPFSFVADWFIPVGSWLSARGLQSALTGTYISTKTQTEFMSGIEALPKPHPYAVPGKLEIRKRVVERRILTELDVPMPSFKPLEKVASWKRAANAVALVVSLASGAKAPRTIYTD